MWFQKHVDSCEHGRKPLRSRIKNMRFQKCAYSCELGRKPLRSRKKNMRFQKCADSCGHKRHRKKKKKKGIKDITVVPFAVPAVGRVSFHRVHSLMTGQRQMLL